MEEVVVEVELLAEALLVVAAVETAAVVVDAAVAVVAEMAVVVVDVAEGEIPRIYIPLIYFLILFCFINCFLIIAAVAEMVDAADVVAGKFHINNQNLIEYEN